MKDTKEVRDFLITEMQNVADGKTDDVKAKGIANLAQQIYNTINLEIRHATALHRLGAGTEVKPVSFD